MRKLGYLVALLGIALCVLHLVEYQHEMLYWIETWGPKRAWLIRGGTIILGLLLVLAAPLPDE